MIELKINIWKVTYWLYISSVFIWKKFSTSTSIQATLEYVARHHIRWFQANLQLVFGKLSLKHNVLCDILFQL